ncbi:MAG: zinc-dependent metalloprotease [Phycisphaeraceae bacterium]|nr:MAG: zinc-dependent metalloprotease [Phycisphaeraceae bacterium]
MAGTTVALSAGMAPTAGETPATPAAQDGTQNLDFGAIQRMMNGGGGREGKADKGADWDKLSEGYEHVVSTTDGSGFYDVWVNHETGDMLAELPRGFERQKHFFAMTVAGGEEFAGLQAGDQYVYWKKYGDDRLALVSPELGIRSTGEQTSKDSVNMLFTDRVILDVPILGKGPSGQPVIDLDNLLVNNAQTFFGRSARGLQSNLKEIAEAKSFPENIEIAYTVPDASGRLKTFHYSISHIQGSPGYHPREADQRIGYFTTSYEDYGKYNWDDVDTRYINRWNLEKADPKLKMSPPKEPIVYYVEHTVPVRYRRYVREGIEYWNEAFRKIGIDGAIEVRYQDKTTGAHMDKDPEDVRYNFIRWLNNNVATAIGPSRVNPETGEILDADVVLTDGWIRVFNYRWYDMLGDLATEGFGPETMAWLDKNPQWDPRVRFASPGERDSVIQQNRRRGVTRYAGHPAASVDPTLLGDDEFDGLSGRVSQVSGRCDAAEGKAMQLAMARMDLDLLGAIAPLVLSESKGDKAPEIPEEMLKKIKEELEKNPDLMAMVPEKYRGMLDAEATDDSEPAAADEPEPEGDGDNPKLEQGDMIDGVPEEFVGPMLAELVSHEVGHTLGLRHNFKGSSAYTLKEINSEDFKGNTPWSASVMDYNGINIFMPLPDGSTGSAQGDYSSINIGPYDEWAIEYGYTSDDTKKVLERVGEPGLDYATDEDTWGPDPLARRYDLSKYPIDYARDVMQLVTHIRGILIDKFVKDGQSWSRARRGYGITLSQQMQAVSMMANWVGGAHVYRDKKGDPNGRKPIDVVDAAQQREALQFVIENTFRDEAFGLTPDLLDHMTVDKWWDVGGMGTIFTDPTYTVHDTVLNVQASAMTMLMNPDTLRRVYDNEYIVPSDQDALTLAELMGDVTDAAWTELDEPDHGRFTDRKPMISSMRRNLQREHLQRLIDLTVADNTYDAASKPIATLAAMHLRDIQGKVDSVLKDAGRLDPYSRAHLQDVKARIAQALDAQYITNMPDFGSLMMPSVLFGQDAQKGE